MYENLQTTNPCGLACGIPFKTSVQSHLNISLPHDNMQPSNNVSRCLDYISIKIIITLYRHRQMENEYMF